MGAAPPAADTSSGLTENVASALCYLLGLFTGILFLVLAPYNASKNVRFHAFQSIFMNIAIVVVWIGFSILSIALHRIPVIGLLFGLSFYAGFSLLTFGLWLFMMYKAYNNEKVVLPIIGPMAEKQA
jgi:uncharacterized membrane protein